VPLIAGMMVAVVAGFARSPARESPTPGLPVSQASTRPPMSTSTTLPSVSAATRPARAPPVPSASLGRSDARLWRRRPSLASRPQRAARCWITAKEATGAPWPLPSIRACHPGAVGSLIAIIQTVKPLRAPLWRSAQSGFGAANTPARCQLDRELVKAAARKAVVRGGAHARLLMKGGQPDAPSADGCFDGRAVTDAHDEVCRRTRPGLGAAAHGSSDPVAAASPR
jgi:hypothetical protein